MTRTIAAAALLVTVGAQAPAPPTQTQTSTAAPSADCPAMATALQGLMRNDTRLRDWAQLARYREANRALPAVQAGQSRIVFMGDSITDAWPQPRYPFFTGKPNYVGRGISGQTTPQMLIRFRPDVIDLKPKAVVILAGTNDIAGNTGPMTNEEIQGNIQSMAEIAKANNIKVVLSSIMPTSAYHVAPNGVPQTTQRPMARIKAINDWMKSYAAANGHVYLDYFSAMIDASGLMKSELTNDDLHPNEAGYAMMGPLVELALEKALR